MSVCVCAGVCVHVSSRQVMSDGSACEELRGR